MLYGSPNYSTGYMEGARECYSRGGDSVWYIQLILYGMKKPLGDSTGTSGYG